MKSKIQIGNVEGPLNYGRKQVVFHHDDVPPNKRERKAAVIDFNRSHTLDLAYHQWNKCTDPQNRVCIRRQRENHVLDRSNAYQYNYRAETVDTLRNVPPIDRSTKFHISTQLPSTAKEILETYERDRLQRGQYNRTLEMPVHPDLVDASPWNISTVLTLKEQKESLDAMTNHARAWTAEVTSTLPRKKEYIGPVKGFKLLQEEIRQLKSEGLFSTKEKLTRPYSEPAAEEKRQNHLLNEKVSKVKRYEHSGVWEKSKIDGRSMWSDTGSYDPGSRGDVVRGTNLDGFNFAGPVKGSRGLEPSGEAKKHHTFSRPQSHNN